MVQAFQRSEEAKNQFLEVLKARLGEDQKEAFQETLTTLLKLARTECYVRFGEILRGACAGDLSRRQMVVSGKLVMRMVSESLETGEKRA